MKSIWMEKRFLMYAIGLMIDRLGNAVYSVALPLMVYHLTHSVLNMSLMAICQFIPRAVCSLFIGSIVDRISRRIVIFTALFFQSGCSFVLAIMYETNNLQTWMLYVFGALISVGFEFSRTAEIAVIPVMFWERRVEATASLASAHTIMFIIGPTVAGILLGFVTYETLLWINAISYLGPILMCLWSKIPNEKDLGGIRSFRSVIGAMGEGLNFLKGHIVLKKLMVVILISGIAIGGIETMILYYVKNDIGFSDMYTSWIIACSGIGLFIGSIFVSRFKNWNRQQFFIVSLSLIFIGLLLFLIPHKGVLMGAQLVLSIGIFSYSVSQDILIQEVVPNEMMGRVGGLLRMISHITLTVSTTLLGWFANIMGTKSVFVFSSTFIILTILMVVKAFSNLDNIGVKSNEQTEKLS
ncbi:MFS transporter [Bacillus paramycoides]|uniref:MFS transporter n=1 Tax=Bacillus paramycoides TaxID=2026194 RepID=UPI003CFE8B61